MVTPQHNDKDLLGQLLFQISGQLRTPLGNIHSALTHLAPPERRELDPELDRNAALLSQSYYQLLRFANNLSDAAAFSSADALPLRSGDLFQLCRELYLRVEPLTKMRGQSLHFLFSGDQTVTSFNQDGIERLVLNLLSNSMKFTPSGGAITLSLSITEETVELSVSDTGCGISQDLLPILFDRYLHPERIDPAPHGLGLGLPICQWIAGGHGGTLSAVSAEGVGTQVTLTFPNRQSPTATVRDVPFDYTGGFNPTLVELADALPVDAFTHEYLD